MTIKVIKLSFVHTVSKYFGSKLKQSRLFSLIVTTVPKLCPRSPSSMLVSSSLEAKDNFLGGPS